MRVQSFCASITQEGAALLSRITTAILIIPDLSLLHPIILYKPSECLLFPPSSIHSSSKSCGFCIESYCSRTPRHRALCSNPCEILAGSCSPLAFTSRYSLQRKSSHCTQINDSSSLLPSHPSTIPFRGFPKASSNPVMQLNSVHMRARQACSRSMTTLAPW